MSVLSYQFLRTTVLTAPNVARMLRAAVTLGAALATSNAQAQARDEMPRDEIVLQLSAEDWVETKTARVIAAADVAIAGEARDAVRDRMLGALKKLSPEADWRLSQFARSQDSAGLERWRVTAEARLPEKALGGLDERAKSLSQPGLQLRVANIQFTPTLEEREATVAALRARIYEQAKQEAAAAAKTWPDRGYRVARVDFQPQPIRPMPMMSEAMPRLSAQGMEPANDSGDALAVAQKITLQATVTLAPSK